MFRPERRYWEFSLGGASLINGQLVRWNEFSNIVRPFNPLVWHIAFEAVRNELNVTHQFQAVDFFLLGGNAVLGSVLVWQIRNVIIFNSLEKVQINCNAHYIKVSFFFRLQSRKSNLYAKIG